MKKLKILYITNLPSPYIVDYLNELGKICELTAVFECSKSTERDKSWQDYRFETFEGHILKGIRLGVDKAVSPGVVRYLKKNKYNGIIVANMCTPTGIIATTYMKIRKIPFIMESEGGFAKDGKGLKEKFKKTIISGGQLYFSTGKIGDDYFIKYGAAEDKIVHFPFTTLYDNEILKHPVNENERKALKAKLGCKSNFMILTIGRFIPCKGMDLLIRACEDLAFPFDLFFVGGQPTEEYIKLQKECNIENVHYLPHASKEIIKEYYKASDIFVLATRGDTWGLVIPEAMSYGAPVISTDACVAALCLIENGENGFVIPVENIESLKQSIIDLHNDKTLCDNIAKKNIEKMQGYSLETMAKRQVEEIGLIS